MPKPTPVVLLLFAAVTCFSQSPDQSKIGRAPSSAAAIDPRPVAPRVTSKLLHDAFSVFALTMAQDRSLDLIEAKFPNMREQVMEARKAFMDAFQPAIEATDTLLRARASDEWAQIRKKSADMISTMDSPTLTSEQAAEYIETVKQRAKGRMPRDIYIVLAALHPDFLKRPELEFARGFHQEFKSDGSGKSLGLKLAIKYPLSWGAEEGRRPHVLWKAFSHDAYVAASLLVKNTPTKITTDKDAKDALEYLASRESLAIEAPGATFVASESITMAGNPAKSMDYENIITRKFGTNMVRIAIRGRFYFVIYGQTLVCFDVCIGDAGGGNIEEVRDSFKRHEKLFELTAQSFDVYNRYQ